MPRSWLLNTIPQQKESGFLGEIADSTSGVADDGRKRRCLAMGTSQKAHCGLLEQIWGRRDNEDTNDDGLEHTE